MLLKFSAANAQPEQIEAALLLLLSGSWFTDEYLLTRLEIADDFGVIAVGVAGRHIGALR